LQTTINWGLRALLTGLLQVFTRGRTFWFRKLQGSNQRRGNFYFFPLYLLSLGLKLGLSGSSWKFLPFKKGNFPQISQRFRQFFNFWPLRVFLIGSEGENYFQGKRGGT